MANAILSSIPDREIVVPEDLREWIDPHTLARLVLAAVQDLNVSRPPGVQQSDHGYSPHVLLSLLTYCYAVGVYRSTDIEFNHGQDSMVGHLAANQCQDAHTLRSFRRHNRQSVRACLSEVLHRAWQLHFRCCTDNVAFDSIEWSAMDSFDGASPLPAVSEYVNLAEERIQTAVRLDCWDFDH